MMRGNHDMNRQDEISLPLKTFRSFDEAADQILHMMSKFIHINTLFIARNDQQTNEIVKALNHEEKLVQAGDTLPFEETLCKISVDKGHKPLVIPDLSKSELTMSLDVTKTLGGGCFIGIPIYYANGENYGTICGLDTKDFAFQEEHIELFGTVASLLTYVLELDQANQQIQNLSAPFVPITDGIAILPIIGAINEQIAENIISLTLAKSQLLSLDYLIIDLSGVYQINPLVYASLMKIVNLLRLLGVEPVLTGMQPEIAAYAVKMNIDLQHIKIEANLEQALSNIGFVLEKKRK